MGRIKRGLDYFPMSTSFMHDRMVRRIMRREGDSAFATLVGNAVVHLCRERVLYLCR